MTQLVPPAKPFTITRWLLAFAVLLLLMLAFPRWLGAAALCAFFVTLVVVGLGRGSTDPNLTTHNDWQDPGGTA